jgi:hypothetical protein
MRKVTTGKESSPMTGSIQEESITSPKLPQFPHLVGLPG